MKIPRLGFDESSFVFLLLLLAFCFHLTVAGSAQAVPDARSFPKPQEEVEKALHEMRAYEGQKLPIVDGFVAAGDQPLDRFQRAFYQLSIDLLPGTTGEDTIVRVSAKITAWYADRDPSKSGYQVLPSNGRLELDFLDRLGEKFGVKVDSPLLKPEPQISKPRIDLNLSSPVIPSPRSFQPASTGTPANPVGDEVMALAGERADEEKHVQHLTVELQNLQEVQRHQAHPTNLVVVKKSGTPVMVRPAEGSHALFSAEADDEFEFLDAENGWIHVQISGASRGYIRRNALDLPEAVAAQLELQKGSAAEEKPAAFRIEREEISTFPGDWEQLKGKPVKIYTVQPISPDSKENRASDMLGFAASLFKKFSAEVVAAAPAQGPAPEGVVVIFDSADGGIVASTLLNARQFAGGSLSQDVFWKLSYVDPPEAFQTPANAQASTLRQK